MVDSVSAEARRKELLDESLGCVYPDDIASIKQRYKDTSLVLFKEQFSQQQADNRSFLSFGTRRSSTVSEYGNTPIIVRKSRSANGELSKVGEQWPSLRGKGSLSNYTLHEGKELGDEDENEEEEEEEDTETEDEVDLRTKSCEEGKKSSGSDEKRKIAVVDGHAVCGKLDEHIAIQAEGIQDNGKFGSAENRKSFSHYDLQQRPRDFIDEEAKDGDIEDAIVKDVDDDDKDAVSMRTVLEVEGVDHKIVLVRPPHKNEPSDMDTKKSEETPSVNINQVISAEVGQKDFKSQSEKDPIESQGENIVIASSIPSKSDQSALLGECSEKASVNNVSSDKPSANIDLEILNHQSSNDWSKVELRIVEPSDLSLPNNEKTNVNNTTSKSNLTSTLLSGEDNDDDDDVVYIDEYSPSPNLLQSLKEESAHSCKECSINPDKEIDLNVCKEKDVDSNKDESQSHHVCTDISSPTPPKRQTKQVSKPSCEPAATSLECRNDVKNEGMEELEKSVEEDQNGLLALPVRSPTPPKRSPRRSPRTPKSKEKNNHERHSSLDLPKNFNRQPSASKSASVSASPATKSKDSSKIFNFSGKKERSRSVSSLNSKKSKDKEKVVRSESEDPGAYNVTGASDVSDDAKCDTPSGKRVGVRSMVIDGTIKRNFIVIHPSDESETIGLAPLSSFNNGSKTSVKASKALSSVKSHITGISSSRMESVKKTTPKHSSKGSLVNTSKGSLVHTSKGSLINTSKGSLVNTSKDKMRDRESLHSDSKTEATKVKKSSRGKKQTESHVHVSTISLSSTVSHNNSKVVTELSEGMSEVECDLVNISTQGIPTSSTKTTSRLCVIM